MIIAMVRAGDETKSKDVRFGPRDEIVVSGPQNTNPDYKIRSSQHLCAAWYR